MTLVEFTVPVLPVGKGRPRHTRTGHVYTPTATRVAEAQIAAAYLHVARPARVTPAPKGVPVSLAIRAVFPTPGSWARWRHERAAHGAYPHTARPDADNIAKTVLDALNGVAWHDDAQVSAVTVTKVYGPGPLLEITVRHYPAPTR